MGALERGITTLWVIWLSRSNNVFNGRACGGNEIPAKVDSYLRQYKEAIPAHRSTRIHHRQHWQPPTDGLLKLNCDGSSKEDGRDGIDAIIRAEDRAVLGVMAAPVEQCATAKEAEVMAIKAGLQFAKDCGFDKLKVESDAMEVIAEIQRQQPSSSLQGPLVDDVKYLMSCFVSCSIRFILRQCNKVVDRLANIGTTLLEP